MSSVICRTVQPASGRWLPLYPAIPAVQSSSAQVNMSAVIFHLSHRMYSTVYFKPDTATVPSYFWTTVIFGSGKCVCLSVISLLLFHLAVVRQYCLSSVPAHVPCYNCSTVYSSAQANMSFSSFISFRSVVNIPMAFVVCRIVCTVSLRPMTATVPCYTCSTVVFCSGLYVCFYLSSVIYHLSDVTLYVHYCTACFRPVTAPVPCYTCSTVVFCSGLYVCFHLSSVIYHLSDVALYVHYCTVCSDLWLPTYPAIPAVQSSSAQVCFHLISQMSHSNVICHLSHCMEIGQSHSNQWLALCPAIWWGQSSSAQVNMSVLICHQSSVRCRTVCTVCFKPDTAALLRLRLR